LSNENKLGVFSRVLGVTDFTETIHFARRAMDHCKFQYMASSWWGYCCADVRKSISFYQQW